MDELEFLEAMNEIEDGLLLDAQKKPVKRSSGTGLLAKAAAVAAILCLLSVTVLAVSVSVRIIGSEDRVWIPEAHYMGMLTPSSKVTTLDYDLAPQNIFLPDQWTETLTEKWKAFGYDYGYFTGIDLKTPVGSRMNFGGLSQLEELLGVELVSSPELEEALRGAFVKLVITDRERASEELRREGRITPDGLVIYLPFRMDGNRGPDPEVVEYCGLNIFLPITESFGEAYRSHAVLSAVGKQDLQESKHRSKGGIETVILANSQSIEDPMKAFAAWEHEGIGYLLELKTYRYVTADPEQMVLPYLEHLEE